MSKQIYWLLIVISIGLISAESPCGDWISYRDEKCFKVISELSQQVDANTICQKEYASLGVINSAEEQEQIYNFLNNSNVANNVWIRNKLGYMSMNNSSLTYTNWKMGRPTNSKGYDCIEISTDIESLGQWIDVKCEKNNAVLCEKDQLISYRKMVLLLEHMKESTGNYSERLKSLEASQFKLLKLNEAQSEEIVHLKQQIPGPVGFIYVQLFGQSEPHKLWPTAEWESVTEIYSGLFFRAEGNGSDSFGQIQEQQTQSIDVKPENCGALCFDSEKITPTFTITEKFFKQGIWTGQFSGSGSMGLNFKHKLEEIRPRNQAIRIWKRIK